MDIKKIHEMQDDIEKMAAEMLTHCAYKSRISGIMYCSYCKNVIEKPGNLAGIYSTDYHMDKDKHKDGCIVNIAKKYIK